VVKFDHLFPFLELIFLIYKICQFFSDRKNNNKNMYKFNSKIVNIIKDENLQPILNTTPFWKLNPDIKKGNIQFEYTDEELKTLISVKQNGIEYFIDFIEDNNRTYNPNLNKITNIKLRDYQKEILRNFNNDKFLSLLSSRQMGISVVLSIYLMKYILSNADKSVLILSCKKEFSIELLDKFKDIYYSLPFYLKPSVLSWNKGSITFDNGCTIKCDEYKKNNGIGYTVNFAIFNDLLYAKEKLLKNIFSSLLPVFSAVKDSKLFLINTGLGTYNNEFYKQYFTEDGDNIFKKYKYHYSLIYNRDDKWKEEIIKIIGEDAFSREYDLNI